MKWYSVIGFGLACFAFGFSLAAFFWQRLIAKHLMESVKARAEVEATLLKLASYGDTQ